MLCVKFCEARARPAPVAQSERVGAIEAGLARQTARYYCMGAHLPTRRIWPPRQGVRGAEDGYDGCLHGRGNVHRSAVITEEEVARLKHRRGFVDPRLPGQIKHPV